VRMRQNVEYGFHIESKEPEPARYFERRMKCRLNMRSLAINISKTEHKAAQCTGWSKIDDVVKGGVLDVWN